MTLEEKACKNQGLHVDERHRTKTKRADTAAERREEALFKAAATQRKRATELHERLRTGDNARKSEAEERDEETHARAATAEDRKQSALDVNRTAGRASADDAREAWASEDPMIPKFLRRDPLTRIGDNDAKSVEEQQSKALKRMNDFLAQNRKRR